MEGKKSLLCVVSTLSRCRKWAPDQSTGLQGRRPVKNAVLYTLYMYTSSQGGTLEGVALQRPTLAAAAARVGRWSRLYTCIHPGWPHPGCAPGWMYTCIGGGQTCQTRPHLTCQSSRSATLCRIFFEKEEVLTTVVATY